MNTGQNPTNSIPLELRNLIIVQENFKTFLKSLDTLSEWDRCEQIYVLWKTLGHEIMGDSRINRDRETGMCSSCFENTAAFMMCPKCHGEDTPNTVCEDCYYHDKECQACLDTCQDAR